ncbi:MAG: DUF362 domain-containing protein [Chitinispirillaceae bacterium]|nr:DUF362 domain-containing protein [Chitinispirillaceae bacterium]
MSLSRRTFLKKSVHFAGAAAIAPQVIIGKDKTSPGTFSPSPLNKWPGRCVLNFNNQHESVPTGGSAEDEAVVKRMVDDSIKLLTGEVTVGNAWKALFPSSLSQSSIIAIKVCFLNNRLPSHPFVVMGIVEGLQQMSIGNGNFPASNITIYDGNNSNSFSSVGFTQQRFPGITLQHYSGREVYPIGGTNYTDGARNLPYSPVLHDADFLINAPNLRGHSSHGEGFTLGFKSHFGTYNPEHTQYPEYLRDYNCTGPVYQKTVLTVISALFGKKEGSGPGGAPEQFTRYPLTKDPADETRTPNTIIMSTDPVTAEFQAIKILRIEGNRSYTVNNLPRYLRASAGVTGALDPTYNIGIINEEQMDCREIINKKETTEAGSFLMHDRSAGMSLMVHQNPGYPDVFIEMVLPQLSEIIPGKIVVVTPQGKRVAEIYVPLHGVRTRIVWNRKDRYGRNVGPGTYVFRLAAGNISLVKKVILR